MSNQIELKNELKAILKKNKITLKLFANDYLRVSYKKLSTLLNGHVNSKEPNTDVHLIQTIKDWMVKLDELSSTTNLEVVHENSDHNQKSQDEKLSNRNLNAFHLVTNSKLPEVFNDLQKNLLKFKISHETFADKILGTNKQAFYKLCKVKSIEALTVAQHQYLNIINNWMKDNNQIFIENDNISQVVESARKRKKKGKINQETRSKKSKKVSVITSRVKIKNTIVKKYRLMEKNKTFKLANKSGKRRKTDFYKKLMKRNDCLLNVLK